MDILKKNIEDYTSSLSKQMKWFWLQTCSVGKEINPFSGIFQIV